MVVAVACISTFVLVVLIGSYVVYLRRKKGAKNGKYEKKKKRLSTNTLKNSPKFRD